MKWKSQSMALMKVLSDPRRERILHLTSDEPKTVKQLADEIGEDPLRLYYHVKKLLEVELLEVADTRQHGNLVEKYYRAVNFRDVIYRGNVEEQAEHSELALSLLHRKLNPAISLYQQGLEKVREEKQMGKKFHTMPYHVSINSASERMTAKEWRKSIEPIMKAIGKRVDDGAPWPDFSNDDDDEMGTYEYILISYRMEDAVQLGVLDDADEQEGDSED